MPDPMFGWTFEDTTNLDSWAPRWGQKQLDKTLGYGKSGVPEPPSLPRATAPDAGPTMLRLLPIMQASGQFDPELMRSWIAEYEKAKFPEEEKQYGSDPLGASQRIQEEEVRRRSSEFKQLNDLIQMLLSGQQFDNPFVR